MKPLLILLLFILNIVIKIPAMTGLVCLVVLRMQTLDGQLYGFDFTVIDNSANMSGPVLNRHSQSLVVLEVNVRRRYL